MAGTVLFRLGIEELTTKALSGHFAHYELRATLSPIKRRTQAQLFGKRIKLQFAICHLQWNQLAIPLKQRGGYKFLFGVGKIGNGYVHVSFSKSKRQTKCGCSPILPFPRAIG